LKKINKSIIQIILLLKITDIWYNVPSHQACEMICKIKIEVGEIIEMSFYGFGFHGIQIIMED
jgi:hypothetical protein